MSFVILLAFYDIHMSLLFKSCFTSLPLWHFLLCFFIRYHLFLLLLFLILYQSYVFFSFQSLYPPPSPPPPPMTAWALCEGGRGVRAANSHESWALSAKLDTHGPSYGGLANNSLILRCNLSPRPEATYIL